MAVKESFLTIMPAKSVKALVYQMAQIQKQTKQGADYVIPSMVLHMRSGKSFEGWVLDVRESEGELYVLMHDPGPRIDAPKYDLIYFAVAEIEAITVRNSTRIAHLLSDGAITKPVASGLKKLDIQKKLEQIVARVSYELGYNLPFQIDFDEKVLDEQDYSSLLLILEDVSLAFVEVAHTLDSRKKTALSQSVRNISIQVAGQPSFQKLGKTIVITIGKVHGGLTAHSRSALRTMIESNLV